MEQRPRSWTARVVIAAVCGALVAAVSLVGYEPRPRSAGAAIQPAPTSIAFVPIEAPPALQARVGAAQVQAAELHSLTEATSQLLAPRGGPEPAPEELPGPEACVFPCVGEDEPLPEDELPAEPGDPSEPPAEALEDDEKDPDSESSTD